MESYEIERIRRSLAMATDGAAPVTKRTVEDLLVEVERLSRLVEELGSGPQEATPLSDRA